MTKTSRDDYTVTRVGNFKQCTRKSLYEDERKCLGPKTLDNNRVLSRMHPA